ncbi:DUF5615 family PIN-like protein [Candidatus Bipolaricaulota bacterium]|nr:DUF5615 family PIN-like protein [Candidatus Bipolaricaulota bacterium]
MSQIRIYTDEDVDVVVAEVLKLRGFQASTTVGHNKLGRPDLDQLRYAGSIRAVMLTHNVQDYPRIHGEFIARGESHAGVIVAKQVPVGEIVRRFLRLAAALSAEDMENRLEYLSNW